MKYPKPVLFGFSWVGILNILFFQWLFLRIQLTARRSDMEITGFSILYPVVPLTGWFSNYIPSQRKEFKFWKTKLADE